MKVRITAVTVVSDGHGHSYRAGQVVELDDALTESWVQNGYAEPAEPQREEAKSVTSKPARKAKRRSK